MSIRISLIQTLIDINERMFFYPKLKSFYKNKVYNNLLPKNLVTISDVGANKGQSIDFFCKINFIQIESHNDDMYMTDELKNDIPKLLTSKGYSKCTFVKHGFGDLDECIYEK